MPSSVIAATTGSLHLAGILLDRVILLPVLTCAQITSNISNDAYWKVMLGPVDIVSL